LDQGCKGSIEFAFAAGVQQKKPLSDSTSRGLDIARFGLSSRS
jgi:hypothetical protein